MAGNKKTEIPSINGEVEEIKEETVSEVTHKRKEEPQNEKQQQEKTQNESTKELIKPTADKTCSKPCCWISMLHILLVGICLFGVFHYYTQFATLQCEVTEKDSLILIAKMGAAFLLALLISFSRVCYLNKCN